MTQKEIYKLKLMSKLETTMTLRELVKWSCLNCKSGIYHYEKCPKIIDNKNIITFNVGIKYHVFTCFESKEE